MGAMWSNTEQNHGANVPLDLGKRKKSCETASCQELLRVVLQIPERQVTSYQAWEMLSEDIQPVLSYSADDRSFEPLPMSTGRMHCARSFMQMPSYRWGRRKPKFSVSFSILPLQMPSMVTSPFLGKTNPFPLRGCGLEACSGAVQRAKSPLRTRQGYLDHTCMPCCVPCCSGRGITGEL